MATFAATVTARTGPVAGLHSTAWAGGVVAVAVLLGGHVPEAAFLALAVAIGLPHGAFDHILGRQLFHPAYGRHWWRPFLLTYLTFVAATLTVWWAAPGFALAAFLLLSLFHFGQEDAVAGASYYPARVLAHGGAVIVVPAAAHQLAVERLFAILAPADATAIAAALAGPLLLVWAAAAMLALGSYLAHGQKGRIAALNLALTVALFTVTAPLIAFSLYFAALHAPRAFAALRREGHASGSALIPLTLTILGLMLGVTIYCVGARSPSGDGIIRTAFLLLSALTVPHMWLEWRLRTASWPTA